MRSIFLKEVNAFFSSLIGYIVIGTFLVLTGLVMFVFPESSILNYNYATLEQLFSNAPLIFLFLIPAITMRSLAEEQQSGTIEFLTTKPLTDLQIILGKYFASLLLVAFALLPTLLYYFTVHTLGAPKGNLDSGAILGSYLGLFLLAGAFAAVGLFASSLSPNQIVAFILGALLCAMLHWGFDAFSRLPIFTGRGDDVVQMLGINYHYASISRGILDSRDVIYFFSVIAFFIALTATSLGRRKW